MPDSPDLDSDLNNPIRREIEAAIGRKMMAHLRKHPEVQNIDLMNLAYFCRNCLSKWYRGAAADLGIEMDYDQAREIVYGMPYSEYRSKHAREASEEQLREFEQARHKASE